MSVTTPTGKVNVPEEELDAMLQEGKGPSTSLSSSHCLGRSSMVSQGRSGVPGWAASVHST